MTPEDRDLVLRSTTPVRVADAMHLASSNARHAEASQQHEHASTELAEHVLKLRSQLRAMKVLP